MPDTKDTVVVKVHGARTQDQLQTLEFQFKSEFTDAHVVVVPSDIDVEIHRA